MGILKGFAAAEKKSIKQTQNIFHSVYLYMSDQSPVLLCVCPKSDKQMRVNQPSNVILSNHSLQPPILNAEWISQMQTILRCNIS